MKSLPLRKLGVCHGTLKLTQERGLQGTPVLRPLDACQTRHIRMTASTHQQSRPKALPAHLACHQVTCGMCLGWWSGCSTGTLVQGTCDVMWMYQRSSFGRRWVVTGISFCTASGLLSVGHHRAHTFAHFGCVVTTARSHVSFSVCGPKSSPELTQVSCCENYAKPSRRK